MPATFGRIKTWVRERLKFSDLNGEFDNILQNFTPTGVDDASADASAMQADTAPAPGGTESLATNLLGELQRIRYVLRRIQGGTYWYSDIGRIASALPSTMFAYLPSGGNTAAEALTDYINRGGLLNALSLSAANVASTDFDGTNKKFGNYAMKVSTTAVYAYPGKAAQSLSLSAHFRNLAAGDYIAYNPQLGIEVFLDGSGFLTARVRRQTAASETAKNFSTVAGSASRAASTTWQHVVTRHAVNGALGAGTDLVHLLRDGASEGTQINAATLPVGVGDGGHWFLSARPNNPTWDHFSAMSVTPDAEAVSPWTRVTAGAPITAVSAGVLSIQVNPLDNVFYQRTSGVNLANMTIEAKVKLVQANEEAEIILAKVLDTSMSRSLLAILRPGQLIITADPSSGTMQRILPLDTEQWNHIRITSLGGTDPITRVYINGVQACVFANTDVIASGGDYFAFYMFGSVSAGINQALLEYYAYVSSVAATVYPVVAPAPSATGQIDDFLAVADQLSSVLVTSLGNNAAASVYGTDYKRGLQLPMGLGLGTLQGAAAARLGDIEVYFVSDGLTRLHLGIQGHIYTTLTPAYVFDLRLIEVGPSSTSLILQSASFRFVSAGVTSAVALGAQRILPQGVYRILLSPNGFNGGDTLFGELVPQIQKGNEVL